MTGAQILNLVIFTTSGPEVLAHILNACWRGVREKPSVTHDLGPGADSSSLSFHPCLCFSLTVLKAFRCC